LTWVGTKRYNFDKNGALYKNMWVDLDGNRYYSKEDGALAIGEQIIDGITYMFDESGKLVNN
ncbi:CHAP domain-containing protein, partial [Enterococcus faecalis]